MKKVLKKIIKISALLACLSVPVFAQTSDPNEKTLPVDVSGQWAGTFDVNLPDGTVQHDTAWFDLKQTDAVITGTAGASVEKQTAITEGRISGTNVQFKMNVRAGTVLTFNLLLADKHLKGEVTGDLQAGKIRIDVVRVKKSEPANSSAPPNLRDEVLRQDQLMFDAFNNRNLERFKTFFSEDLEFYQDLTGVTNYLQNIEIFRTNFAKNVRVRRELDLKSLEIYPLKNYGAMEIGTHRFYTTEPGQAEKLTAEVKFVNVWQKHNDNWKITRVISYGH